MKYTLIIDKSREEEVLIYAHKRNALVDEIETIVLEQGDDLFGFKDKETVKLSPTNIYCFISECNKVYAVTENDKYLIKHRLYELEERLGKDFIKINKSCIANIKKIKKFDASIYGSIKVVFKNGYEDYVSRRNVKNIKERLGF